MASIRRLRLSDDRIVYKVIWREGAGNDRRQRTKNFNRHADARTFEAKMAREVESRRVGDPNRATVAQYLENWLAFLDAQDELSVTTRAGYRRYVKLATHELGGIPLERLTAEDLDRAYAKLKTKGGAPRSSSAKAAGTPRPLAARSILHLHRVLHCAFEQARKWRHIAENPARDASPPSPGKSPVKAFTDEEVNRLLDEALSYDPELHLAIACLLACGMRRSELLGLAFDCVDLDAGRITIRRSVIETTYREPVLRAHGKTESSLRTIAIPAALTEMLRKQKIKVQEAAIAWRDYQREPLLVFPGLHGGPSSPQRLTERLRHLMKRAKVEGPSPVHAWRHTAATALIHAGANIKTVQARLGHASPATTLGLYTHPTEAADQAAADHFEGMLNGRAS
jgi:integrase